MKLDEDVTAGADHRLQRLMVAAADHFLRDGYTASTVEGIAKSAGISKKTIYKVFPSKLALLEALVRDRLTTPVSLEGIEGQDAEERVLGALLAYAKTILKPENIALMRMIITDGKDAKALADSFRQITVEQDFERFTSFLTREAAAEDWQMPIGGALELSRYLFGMTIGRMILHRLLRSEETTGDEQQIRGALSIFVRGVRHASR